MEIEFVDQDGDGWTAGQVINVDALIGGQVICLTIGGQVICLTGVALLFLGGDYLDLRNNVFRAEESTAYRRISE